MNRDLVRATLMVFSLSLCSLPGVVRAGPDDIDAGRDLYQRAKEDYREGRYSDALQSFQGCLKLKPRPSVLIMIARTYRRLNRPDQALNFYRRYNASLESAGGKTPSPHAKEVMEQIAALDEHVKLVQRAESLLDQGKALDALPVLNEALKRFPWTLAYAGLARCYFQLKRPDRAMSSLKVALGYWEGYRIGWNTSHPGTRPPDDQFAGERIAQLKALELRIAALQLEQEKPKEPKEAKEPAPPEVSATTATPPPPADPAPRKRSTPLLALGISSAALALASEGLAWGAYVEAEDKTEGADFDKYQNLYIAGHVVAGAMALASGVLFYLWYRSGEPEPQAAAPAAGLMVTPLPGGAAVAGGFTF